jgi:hypothetical protein
LETGPMLLAELPQVMEHFALQGVPLCL